METDALETADQIEPNIVKSLSAVGRYFKVSQPAVSKWKTKGMPVEEDGSYSLPRIAAWRALTVAREAESLDKVEGVEPEIIAEVKKELGRFRRLAEVYKMERGEVFASSQAKMLSLGEQIMDSINEKDISKMHIRDKIKAVKDLTSSVSSLHTQERLENDESTSNVQIIVAQIKDLKRREAEKRKAEEEKNKSLMVRDGNQSS